MDSSIQSRQPVFTIEILPPIPYLILARISRICVKPISLGNEEDGAAPSVTNYSVVHPQSAGAQQDCCIPHGGARSVVLPVPPCPNYLACDPFRLFGSQKGHHPGRILGRSETTHAGSPNERCPLVFLHPTGVSRTGIQGVHESTPCRCPHPSPPRPGRRRLRYLDVE